MKNIFLLLILSLCLSITSYGQDDLLKFETFQVGVHTGGSILGGDLLLPVTGFNVGIHAIKSFTESFSVRSSFSVHQLKGFDYSLQPISELENRAVINLGYTSFVNNHSTNYYDFTIEPLLVARHSKISFYVGVGTSFHFYTVRYDALDANGDLYDFSPLMEVVTQRGSSDRSDIEIIKNILDGNYETVQPRDDFEKNNFLGISARTGFGYDITSKFNLGIEARYVINFQDSLDGFRSIDPLFITNDILFSFSILGSYAIGK
jgi:hypothetical protein